MPHSILHRAWTSFEILPFCALLFLTAASTIGSAPGVTDPDYYWHLATGRFIATEGRLPYGDPFSFSNPGLEWVLEEWPFQLAVYWLQQLWGHQGPLLLAILIVTASLYIAYKAARLFMPARLPCLVYTIIAALPMIAFTAPRPHLTTYLMFSLFLYVIVRAKFRAEHKLLLLLPVLMIVWVNLHGGFAIGLALLLAFLGAETFRWLLDPAAENGGKSLVKFLALAFMLCVVAGFINVDGPKRFLYPLETVGMTINTDLIEWRSASFKDALPRLYLVIVFGWLVWSSWRVRRPDVTELSVPLALAFAGFSSWRHMPFAIMILIPMGARALADLPVRSFLERVRDARGPAAPVASFALSFPSGSRDAEDRFRRIADGLIAAVLIAGTAVVSHISVGRARGPDSPLPIEAVNYLKREQLQGRMLNDYGSGGYLVWELYPQVKVFIDGRAGLYGNDFVKTYFAAAAGGPSWRRLMDEWQFDYALLPVALPLTELLLAEGRFEERYRDGKFIVLQRPESSTRDAPPG